MPDLPSRQTAPVYEPSQPSSDRLGTLGFLLVGGSALLVFGLVFWFFADLTANFEPVRDDPAQRRVVITAVAGRFFHRTGVLVAGVLAALLSAAGLGLGIQGVRRESGRALGIGAIVVGAVVLLILALGWLLPFCLFPPPR